MNNTSGILFIHCVSAALKPHVQWTCESALEQKLHVQWKPQPEQPGTWCAHVVWKGEIGLSTKIASALFRLHNVWFEVTEKGTQSTDSSRIMYTPALGLFHTHTDQGGNFVITEEQVKRAYEVAAGDPAELYRQFSLALGEPWDNQIEPYRSAHELTSVTVLSHHRKI